MGENCRGFTRWMSPQCVGYSRESPDEKSGAGAWLQMTGAYRESFFHFLSGGVHNWHNGCLWCVDYNEGFISSE